MATGADLGVVKCLWASCNRIATQLVDTGGGRCSALCDDHATTERSIAKKKRQKNWK